MSPPILTLDDDCMVEILICCYDDLKTIMNFSLACSELRNLVVDRSVRLWYIIVMNILNEQEYKGFKSSTLSILDISDTSKKCRALMNIARTQLNYKRKRQIIKEYRQQEMMNKFKYISNLKVADPGVDKLITCVKNDSLKFAPDLIIKEAFRDCPLTFIIYAQCNPSVSLFEIVDSLFKKRNAHLELDIKNRTKSSSIYDFWKKNTQDLMVGHQLFHFKHYIGNIHFKSVENVILLLKLLYLEFPNTDTSTEELGETGYEQEKHSTGIFKRRLEAMRKYFRGSSVFKTGSIEFEKLLYGDDVDSVPTAEY